MREKPKYTTDIDIESYRYWVSYYKRGNKRRKND